MGGGEGAAAANGSTGEGQRFSTGTSFVSGCQAAE